MESKTKQGSSEIVAQRYCLLKTTLAEPGYTGHNRGVKGRDKVIEERD
jgi:hypothetical protein